MPAPSASSSSSSENTARRISRNGDSSDSKSRVLRGKSPAAVEAPGNAGGPRQATNPNNPPPGTQPKDIALESARPDDGDEKSAIGRLDTDRDSDASAAAARKRAGEFNPTRPWDVLRRPGREL